MKFPFLSAAAALALSVAASALAQTAAIPEGVVESRGFAFQSRDMVALVGAAFLERDGEHGYLETALTQAQPDLELRFRNLAWSGDTVWGHARSYFGPPQEGLDRLKGHLELIKPTVVVCQYGAAEAWDGKEKLGAFIEGYGRLLDMISAAASKPRLVLVSPVPAENRPPAPSVDAYNANLALYRDAIRTLAAQRSAAFVDAFGLVQSLPEAARPLTENGVNVSAKGYRFLGSLLPGLLGAETSAAPVDEKLRSLVLAKNQLFFHRWRPANETYLFGFRKHEQGRNGAEIPLFDPLVEAKEKEIATHLAQRTP